MGHRLSSDHGGIDTCDRGETPISTLIIESRLRGGGADAAIARRARLLMKQNRGERPVPGKLGGDSDRLRMADFAQRLSDQAATATSEKGDGILLPD